MTTGRSLILAVDGLDNADLSQAPLRDARRPRTDALLRAATRLRVRSGGPSEPAPSLASVMTGASVAHTGVATEAPLDPACPRETGTWYASDLRLPSILDQARENGLVTGALQWPATAGGSAELCLPLVEDLGRYRDRWAMAEQTSSPRMVAEHLRSRRAAGVQLSQVEPDDLVAQVAEETFRADRAARALHLALVRLAGLGRARRRHGHGSPEARRALERVADAVRQDGTQVSRRWRHSRRWPPTVACGFGGWTTASEPRPARM